MKEIKLTSGYIALVDDEDYEELNKYKWSVHKTNSGRMYACRMVLMHREITKCLKGFDVDHKDNNGFNNQKVNLRVATRTQNNMNKAKYPYNVKTGKPCESKYKGVTLSDNKTKWICNIRNDRKVIHLGTFDTEDQAALAYNKAALKLHGEFAKLNEV